MLIGQAPATITEPFSLPTTPDTNPATNPYQADVVAITLAASPAQQLRYLTHRRASRQENALALYYYREGAWKYMPQQPICDKDGHPVINRQYRTPATIQFELADPLGLLLPENLESVYNYLSDTTTYDPLLDEARKICLRSGTRCFANLAAGIAPTASTAPSAGTLAGLTDDTFADIATTTTGFTRWGGAQTQIDIDVDLGTSQRVRHVAVRFASKVGTCQLPESMQIGLSTDGVNYTYFPKAAARSLAAADGDWDQPVDAIVIHEALTDLERDARYVRFRIAKLTGNTLAIDELAVYGGSTTTLLGQNVFTGYLGDSIDVEAYGVIGISATDVLKRLQDNNSVRLTAQYTQQDASQIVYNFLTNTAYWKGAAGAYDAPFTSGEIAWGVSDKLTGFIWPVFQDQNNSIFGYVQKQPNEIGWEVWANGSGVVQLTEPPYKQLYPQHILRAGKDATNEVRYCKRRRTGKLIRNRVEVSSGQPNSGAASSVFRNPTSAKRYGERSMGVTDPVATTTSIRGKIGQKILRDYAWRVQALQAAMRLDPYTQMRQVFGFRAEARPYLYPKKCTVGGKRRLQELWYVESYEEHYTIGEIWATGSFQPYVASGTDPPTGITVQSGSPVAAATVRVNWTAPTDINNQCYYNFYVSTSETSFPTTPTATVLNNPLITTYDVYHGYADGTVLYLYVTVTGPNGQESLASEIVRWTQGGSGDGSGWAISDLTASFTQVSGDATSLYTYVIGLQWSSPPVPPPGVDNGNFGFKHAEFRFKVGAIPSNPTNIDSWDYQDQWHGDRIPPGKQWDRVTNGYLTWPLRFRTASPLAPGTVIYIRVWTSQATTNFNEIHYSNVASCTIP